MSKKKPKPPEPEASDLKDAAAMLFNELRALNLSYKKHQPNPRSGVIAYFNALIRFLGKFDEKAPVLCDIMYQMMFEELPPMLPDWIQKVHADFKAQFGHSWKPQVIDGDKNDQTKT